MNRPYNFEGISIDTKDRSAIVRYHNQGNWSNYMQPVEKDIKVIFHEGGEMDFENFEFLTDDEFSDLTMFIYNDEAINKAFPYEI